VEELSTSDAFETVYVSAVMLIVSVAGADVPSAFVAVTENVYGPPFRSELFPDTDGVGL
jgi:hypothetical protein